MFKKIQLGVVGVFIVCRFAAAAPQQPQSGIVTPDSDAVLEQGKELYATGQYMAALDKFMKVLRRDPQQPEAREYLRLVVDEIRNKRAVGDPKTVQQETNQPFFTSAPAPQVAAPVTSPPVDVRHQLRQRQLFATDLAAIPGVMIKMDSRNAIVEIKTSLLFADNTGGLREEGVPILDRVAAWLKTFGYGPIGIHCLPEERDSTGVGGSLFLHRYAQLYGYFVDERKLSGSRFIASGPMGDSKDANNEVYDLEASTSAQRILIVAIGGADSGGYNSIAASPSRWLEFSLVVPRPSPNEPPRTSFNPDEGEWATLDLAALSPKKVASWRFMIVPPGVKPEANRKAEAVLLMEGQGNLLKRVSWDGRHQKTSRFVSPGNYLCRLVATNADGTSKSEDVTLQVMRTKAVVVASKPKPKPKPKPAAAPVVQPSPAERGRGEGEGTDLPSSQPSPVVSAERRGLEVPTQEPTAAPPSPEPAVVPVAAVVPETEAAPASEAAEDETSSDAIWKQVIQFDTNDSELKPTLKASLERIGKTLEVYPLQKVRITGFAMKSEKNPAGLAKERAERVRQTLVSEYQVDAKRILVSEGKVGSSSKAEISITN